MLTFVLEELDPDVDWVNVPIFFARPTLSVG